MKVDTMTQRNSLSTAKTVLFLLGLQIAVFAVGESAVITLVFPPGARATGLGETFTGIAEDVEATFYNPAGLGQRPMANSWRTHKLDDGRTAMVIAARKKQNFGNRERVWVGTESGLLRYNGRVWESYETYIIEEGEDLYDVADKFITVDDDEAIERAVVLLKAKNGIHAKRSERIEEILSPVLTDSSEDAKQGRIDQIASSMLALEQFEQTPTKVYGIIADQVDSSKADELADSLAKVYDIEDTEFSDLVEIKVPFDIAVTDSVTAMTLDNSNRVWIGTQTGLWRYDGNSWTKFTMLDGLPSNNITALAVDGHEILVGTDFGLGLLSAGEWETFSTEDGLPDSKITAVAFGGSNVLYAGTAKGLARRKKDEWIVFDTADGLLSRNVSTLLYDSRGTLWIGGAGGVTLYDQTSWKRYKFPDSHVAAFAEHTPGVVWIATNRGAISYRANRPETDDEGNVVEQPPTWKVFHSKNSRIGDNVYGVAIHGKDVWLATDASINQYDQADREFMMFYEPILPQFGLRDLWHIYMAGILPTEDWGTIGLTLNYLNFGENEWTDEFGRAVGSARSWEGVVGLSYGLPIKEDLSLGLNLKYVHSALAPGYGKGGAGVGQTFAVDAAILKRDLFIDRFNLGFMLQNMGPPIYYIDPNDPDPIPFVLRGGLSYRALQTPIHDILLAFDVDREVVKNRGFEKPDLFYQALWNDFFKQIVGMAAPDAVDETKDDAGEGDSDEQKDREDYYDDFKEDFIYHFGLEYWYVQFLALRLGYMHDETGFRHELSFGLGLQYGNLGFDWSYITVPRDTQHPRHGQWRMAFLFRI